MSPKVKRKLPVLERPISTGFSFRYYAGLVLIEEILQNVLVM